MTTPLWMPCLVGALLCLGGPPAIAQTGAAPNQVVVAGTVPD